MSDLILNRYVAGMTWSSLVARGDLRKLAKGKAVKEKGNWYAHQGKETSVGIATLPKKVKPAPGERYYSLARNAGLLHAYGVNFLAIVVPEGEHAGKVWICGLDSGRPSNGFDALVSDIEAPARLEAFLQQRGISEAECGIYGDASGMPGSINPTDWEAVTAIQGEGDYAALQPTQVGLIEGMSPAQRAGALIVLFLFGTWYGWGEYGKYRRKKAAQQALAQEQDPTAEWNAAIRKWADAQIAPGGGPLLAVREGISHVPTQIAGWTASSFTCSLGQPGWTCVGAYGRREHVKQDPTTLQFKRAAPEGWKINAKSLDAIDVVFEVPVTQPALVLDSLKTPAFYMEEAVSELQKISRAFASVSMAQFLPVAIQTPMNKEGRAIPEPAGIAKPVQSTVVLNGPMRSIDLDQVSRLPVAWKSFNLTIRSADSQASLLSSQLLVSVTGDLYAKP